MTTKHSLVLTTCPDIDAARTLARELVKLRLAACGQIMPIESTYIWQDKLHEETEYLLMLKTRTALFDQLQAAIERQHSYEVPQITHIPITDGLPAYLNWIDRQTSEGVCP